MGEKNDTFSTQIGLLMEFFQQHSDRDIKHPEIVDWAVAEWQKRTGKVFRDPDRGIRSLYQQGFLKKVAKGVYCYSPELAEKMLFKEFTAKQKEAIFERDKYRCVICGKGKKEGEEIHADHIKPRSKGGSSEMENGQTLCSQHNFIKKNFNQTETGKKMFIRLYELAKKKGNREIEGFCVEVLKAYDLHGINGHIEWEK